MFDLHADPRGSQGAGHVEHRPGASGLAAERLAGLGEESTVDQLLHQGRHRGPGQLPPGRRHTGAVAS